MPDDYVGAPNTWTVRVGDSIWLGVGLEVNDELRGALADAWQAITVTAVHYSPLNSPLLPHIRIEGVSR